MVESWFNYLIHASGTSSRGAGYGILAVVTFQVSLCYYSVIYHVFWIWKKLEHIPIIIQCLYGHTWQVLTKRLTQQVSIYKRKVRKRLEVRNVAIPHLSHLDTHSPPLYNTCYTHPSFMAHPLDLALHTFHFPITNISWLIWHLSDHCLQLRVTTPDSTWAACTFWLQCALPSHPEWGQYPQGN